ncbi:hypothetical protein K1T71_013659 [Dendrolimus kikuchii]|uniref:Uncharacterized protein n=1 Tax=Dendrolimus kikuchii TaxID=765133 RepID=A0ACC1CHG0_9NEOP|nr:hypothetical protein K1T71_013659 [Dendrolimus kikuchii]
MAAVRALMVSNGFYSTFTLVLGIIALLLCFQMAVCRNKYRKPMPKYPKDTEFWATDFFVKGCKNFLSNCPAAYKYQHICARSYNGDFRNFANYCEMQYENCNTWRNWRVFKREQC